MSTPYTESWLKPEPSKTFELYTRFYSTPSKPKASVIFIHGFADHVDRQGYHDAFCRLAEREIAVLSFDKRGFGKTWVESIKRKDGSYARTSWPEEMSDVEFLVRHVNKETGTKVFLMGHSMGGGMTLGLCTRSPPLSIVQDGLVAGAIAGSPMILQTIPASKLLKWAGSKASYLFPNLLFPAEVKAEYLTHDPQFSSGVLKDPLVRFEGTLRQLRDMLEGGERLLAENHKYFPETLPLLILHGSGDMITSPTASQQFYDKVNAKDKTLEIYEDAFHDLWHEPEFKGKVIDKVIDWILAHT